MLLTRVMPCLLLRHGSLVKTIQFKDPSYVGDPINAIGIYNELEVDELVFLDISATTEGRPPPFDVISRVAGECFMPVTYGGGVRTLDEAKRIFELGIEKVAVNTLAVEDPGFVSAAADRFGSQSVVVSIDARRKPDGRYEVYTRGGRFATRLDPVGLAMRVAQLGAGEILLTSIDRDGTMSGYDIDLIQAVTRAVRIPVIACGGAGKVEDFGTAVIDGGAAAVATGSMVVYYGKNRAVLINFPDKREIDAVLTR